MIFYTSIWLSLFPEILKHLTQSLKTLKTLGPYAMWQHWLELGRACMWAVSLPLPLLYVLQCDLHICAWPLWRSRLESLDSASNWPRLFACSGSVVFHPGLRKRLSVQVAFWSLSPNRTVFWRCCGYWQEREDTLSGPRLCWAFLVSSQPKRAGQCTNQTLANVLLFSELNLRTSAPGGIELSRGLKGYDVSVLLE